MATAAAADAVLFFFEALSFLRRSLKNEADIVWNCSSISSCSSSSRVRITCLAIACIASSTGWSSDCANLRIFSKWSSVACWDLVFLFEGVVSLSVSPEGPGTGSATAASGAGAGAGAGAGGGQLDTVLNLKEILI